MVTKDRKCNVCGSDMFLDHVEVVEGRNVLFYSCSNTKCREFDKAYTLKGVEKPSKIKKETSLFE